MCADGIFSSSHLMRCSTTVCRRGICIDNVCRHYTADVGALEMHGEQRRIAFIWVRFGFALTSSHSLFTYHSHKERERESNVTCGHVTHVANIMPTNNTYDSSAPSYLGLHNIHSVTVVPDSVPTQLHTCVQYNLRLKAPRFAYPIYGLRYDVFMFPEHN